MIVGRNRRSTRQRPRECLDVQTILEHRVKGVDRVHSHLHRRAGDDNEIYSELYIVPAALVGISKLDQDLLASYFGSGHQPTEDTFEWL